MLWQLPATNSADSVSRFPANTIGIRSFTMEDQQLFADISGDCNPIHLDERYARRCITGGVVVHGMHTLLWALDCWAHHCTAAARVAWDILHLKAKFLHPLRLGCLAECRLSVGSTGRNRLEVVVSGKRVLCIDMLVAHDITGPIAPPAIPLAHRTSKPQERSLASLTGLCGSWPFAVRADMEGLAPHFRILSGGNWPTFLALSSHLIGMECPGLNSLLSGLEFSLDVPHNPSPPHEFSFKVTHVDDRFSRVTLEVQGGGISGTIQAFVRPVPVKQPNSSRVSALVPQQAFAHQRALVIGGSRGLGELAAKMLALGGADVCLTYHLGQDEAQAVVRDILDAGGSARALSFDVTQGADIRALTGPGWSPTHLYYFATPFIAGGNPVRFSNELFTGFSNVYVSGFFRLAGELIGSGLTGVLYPSTVALETFPPTMNEYCAAKAAGEAVCQILARRHRDLHVECIRFPRLATDETVSFLPVEAHDPVPYVLRALIRLATAQK